MQGDADIVGIRRLANGRQFLFGGNAVRTGKIDREQLRSKKYGSTTSNLFGAPTDDGSQQQIVQHSAEMDRSTSLHVGEGPVSEDPFDNTT